jgi:hypothetical protein
MNAKRRGFARRVLRQGWMRTKPPKGGGRRSGGWVMLIASGEKMGKAEVQCLE